VDHTTFFDANLFKKNLVNLSEQTDDRERQSNGVASFILSKQTFNYTDIKKRPVPYLEKLNDSYKLDDELESIFYSREQQQVANGALVVENKVA
jgi:hypothetical protein